MSLVAGLTSVASIIGVETIVQRGVRDELLAEVFGIVSMLNVASGLTVLAGVVVLRAFAGSGS